jgi:hypothetical protein
MSKNTPSAPVISKPSSKPAPQITIDGASYSLDELTDTTKQQLVNVRVVDQELVALQRQQAIYSVARSTYVQAVSSALPKEAVAPAEGAPSAVINGVTYDWASLGERVQGLVLGIRAADQELGRLKGLIQMAQASRGAFAQNVKKNLPQRAEA